MIVTNITPCIKVEKENNIGGVDMYIELGSKVKVYYDRDKSIVGFIGELELGLDEYEDDILHLLLENNETYDIAVSSITDIEEL
ncbi:hypothetical protein HMPREF1092_03195 [Clostridium thermobutyricum]|uniref:DUF4926 domain-containing protein n=1 Tax=Clostridium thermobutyricum TaxID=29372 RepID=N9W980_9CLOT|nr:hypothetical protein [Clostridium thermobutyricum]ENY99454.1 hypothetical protein HMPREF1092_03195 [Clostridium thermobutyricum]